VFHLARLLKNPQAFGFEPCDWVKPSLATSLENKIDKNLNNGAAEHRWEIKRCLGFQP
jgi:hypothetical protein